MPTSHRVTPPKSSIRTQFKAVPSTPFLNLARQRRFQEIVSILDSSDRYDLDSWLGPKANDGIANSRCCLDFGPLCSREDSELSVSEGETPLHLIIHYNPTEAVVDKLISYMMQSNEFESVPEDTVDLEGRTPLHVAAMEACEARVIDRLLSGVSAVMPAVAKDNIGRHALHWACANPHGRLDRNKSSLSFFSRSSHSTTNTDNMLNVIRLLLKAYPEAVAIADAEGNTPLDLASRNKADRRILKVLQDNAGRFPQINSVHKQRGKQSTIHDKETMATVLTSLEGDDFPLEFTEASDVDFDEISSIGSCGVSHYRIKKKTKARRSRKPSNSRWALHVTTVEEGIEL